MPRRCWGRPSETTEMWYRLGLIRLTSVITLSSSVQSSSQLSSFTSWGWRSQFRSNVLISRKFQFFVFFTAISIKCHHRSPNCRSFNTNSHLISVIRPRQATLRMQFDNVSDQFVVLLLELIHLRRYSCEWIHNLSWCVFFGEINNKIRSG